MSRFQRVRAALEGIFMLLGAAILLLAPEGSTTVIMLVLAISLVLRGISELIYYFTMARFMVGGKLILFIGCAFFDLGIFTLSFYDESKLLVIVYLLGFHAFAGLVNILRAIEAKRYKSGTWIFNALQGGVSILIAAASFLFAGNEVVLVYLYCAGLGYNACMRLAAAFKRTQAVYIQ